MYVTHDQIEAMTLSDKIVVMNQGLIEQIGSPIEIYRFPQSRFVAEFIGRANFIPGIAKHQEKTSLTLEVFQHPITLAGVRGSFTPEQPVTVVMRPEMIEILKTGGVFPGVIRRAVYLGNIIEYDVEIGWADGHRG